MELPGFPGCFYPADGLMEKTRKMTILPQQRMTSSDCALVAERFIRISSSTSSRSRLEIRPERRTSSSRRFRDLSRPWLELAAVDANPLKQSKNRYHFLRFAPDAAWEGNHCSPVLLLRNEDSPVGKLHPSKNTHSPHGTPAQTLRMLKQASLRLADRIEHDVPSETREISHKFAGPQNRGHVLCYAEKNARKILVGCLTAPPINDSASVFVRSFREN